MTLAALIAGVGRILDQPILIVGAMVVGPEFAPLAAICFALAHPRLAMLPVALQSLGTGFAVATAFATVVWIVAYQLGAFTRERGGERRPHRLHRLAGRLVVRGGLPGRGRRHAVPDHGQVRPPGRCLHLDHDHPRPGHDRRLSCLRYLVRGPVIALAQLGINLVGILLAGTTTLLVQRLVWRQVAGTRPRRSVSRS